jgi:hypothetical protein
MTSLGYRISEPMQTSLWGVTQRALFDEASAKSTFPEVDVLHIVCWKSNLGTLWGYHCMKSLYQERYASGRFVRPLSFKIAEDANHFVKSSSSLPIGMLTPQLVALGFPTRISPTSRRCPPG